MRGKIGDGLVMNFSTERILQSLVDSISTINEIESIGMSGDKQELPKAGEGDIDIFIYCDEIPEFEKRQFIINQLGNVVQEGKLNVFEGGHWGIGDVLVINGVETWLMYFTVSKTLSNMESILNGDYPDKLDNYYYPIGRIAMLKDICILYDRRGFLNSLKERLSEYPDELANTLVSYHLDKLEDIEDLERAVRRKDVLFYHFAMDIAMDHFLQALFAINKVYFPSRKRTFEFLAGFGVKPARCCERILNVIKYGSDFETLMISYEQWSSLVVELRELYVK